MLLPYSPLSPIFTQTNMPTCYFIMQNDKAKLVKALDIYEYTIFFQYEVALRKLITKADVYLKNMTYLFKCKY